jgi:hypothetical protein
MPTCRILAAALACVLALAATACATTTHMSSSCAPGQHPALDERLYFGTQRPDGVVSDGEWNGFVDEVIAAALPDGFTTWPAQGAWRGADGTTIRETSHVLAVVRPPHAAGDGAIGRIIAAYRTRFAQEAVLRTTTPTCQ